MTFLPQPSYESLDALGSGLREALIPFIGERAVSLFSYAIADARDSPVISAPLRKTLIDAGEDPDNPDVTEAEQLLIDWGRLIATTPGEITTNFYARLESTFNPQLRLLLVAYASQLVAATTFATVGQVALDESLLEYRKPGDDRV